MKINNILIAGILIIGLFISCVQAAPYLNTPIMTSNTTPGTNQTFGINELLPNYAAFRAFDQNSATYGYLNQAPTIAVPVYYQLNMSYSYVPSGYGVLPYSAAQGINNVTLYGSNDGSTWTELDSQVGITGWVDNVMKNYTIVNSNSYTKFRVSTNSSIVGAVSMRELWIYGNVTPIASFTTNQTLGYSPLPVQFTDTSLFYPTSWQWGLKNVTGNNSWINGPTTQNPEITFLEGNWSLNLTATNIAGSHTSTQVTFVNVSAITNSITADFTISNSTGFAPLLTHFTDTSTTVDATIDAWNWSFGDGNVSTTQSPDHTYVSNGTFQVNLTITNTSYSLVSTKLDTVTVYRVPNADFSSFNTAGTAPFTTYLYDTSTNLNDGPYTYFWDLGDGNTSTSQNFFYTWNITGTFDVKHSITDSVTTAWKNETGYITVGTAAVAPVASFYGGPELGAPPLQVYFTDVSTNTPTSWNWSFGDGTFGITQNPEHWYNQSGFYMVNLTATNTAGSNMTSKSNFVMVY